MRIFVALAAVAALSFAAACTPADQATTEQNVDQATDDAGAALDQAGADIGAAANNAGEAVEGAVNDAATEVEHATDDNEATH